MSAVDSETERLDRSVPDPAAEGGEAAGAVDLAGRVLGRFTVTALLARGGAGEVWRAEEPQLGRTAVVKILRRDRASTPRRVERFLREARLASRIDHPYAVHIYAFGAEEDGLLWLAMEHVRGSTLEELVAARGPVPAAVFVPLFARLCEVVHTAHEAGIVHRDIKASNVMAVERAGQLLPKLLDLGIAKLGFDDGSHGVAGDAGDSLALTGHGATVGSPHYMAPEQWTHPSSVDRRADIYALGVLAYRCLGGRLPFAAVDRERLAEAHCVLDPPRLVVELPAALEAAIRRAMAKEPERRFATALAMADEVVRATGAGAAGIEAVPILDGDVRDAWIQGGPQPLADAVARLAGAASTVESDGALRELVAVACRWLAAVALAARGAATGEAVSACARALVERDDAAPWLDLARAAADGVEGLAGLTSAVVASGPLGELALRLDGATRRRTAAELAADVAAVGDALRGLSPLLTYRLVVGRHGAAESWTGRRRRERERLLLWGSPITEGDVALLDPVGRIALSLSPAVQVGAPMPGAETELFLLWRSGRSGARLVASPWGYEREDADATRLLADLRDQSADTTEEEEGSAAPYRGLSSYGADDAAVFVGREREVEGLLNRMVRATAIAVLGPSGVGKSSFLHAGVVARLAGEHRVISLRPGPHPLAALSDAIPAGPGALVERIRAAADAPRGLVLVIDQLEELITLCGDAAEREAFAAALSEATAPGGAAAVRVLAGLRDDFASLIESVAGFRGRFDVFVLGPPSPDALARIVIEPARRAGVSIDPSLVAEMVGEVSGRASALPLLSFTAARLWAARDRERRAMTRAAYDALGGVGGALASYADEIHAGFAARQRPVVRAIFTRLIAPDGTRVPLPRAEIAGLAPEADAVIAGLVDARLLIAREGPEGADLIEVVHECLAERWPLLERWRREEAGDQVLLGDLAAAAHRWQEQGRLGDLLWRGASLVEARRMQTRSGPLTTEVEQAFLRASERAERSARRLRVSSLLAVILVLSAGVALLARLRGEADEHREQAVASAAAARDAARLAEDRFTDVLVGNAWRELSEGRSLPALAYLTRALERGVDGPGMRFAVDMASWSWRQERAVLRAPGASIESSVRPAHGRWIAGGDDRGHVRWWRPDGTLLGDLDLGVEVVTDLVTDPEGRRVVASGQRLWLFEPDQGPSSAREIEGGSDDVVALFGPDDQILVIRPGEIEVRDARGALVRRIAIRDGTTDVAIAPVGRGLVGTGDGVVFVDITTGRVSRVSSVPTVEAGFDDRATRFAFVDIDDLDLHLLDGNGRELRVVGGLPVGPRFFDFDEVDGSLWIGIDGRVVGHDHDGRPIGEVRTTGGPISALDVDGDRIWTGTGDGVIRAWRRDGLLLASLAGHAADLTLVDRIGANLISASLDGTMRVWNREATQLEPFETSRCTTGAVGVDPTGKTVVVACTDGGGVVWTDGGAQQTRIEAPGGIFDIEIAAGGRPIVAADGALPMIWERGARAPSQLPVVEEALVSSIELLPDGRVIGLGNRGRVIVWDLARKTGQVVWRDDQRTIGLLTPLPSGDLIVADHRNRILLLRADGAGGWRLAAEADRGAAIASLSATPAGDLLAAGLSDGRIALLRLPELTLERELPSRGTTQFGVSLDADGGLVATTAGDGAIALWERATGQALAMLPTGGARVLQPAFTPAGLIVWIEHGWARWPLARDRRPAVDLLRELACRLPLRLDGATLVSATPTCGPGAIRPSR